MFTVSNLVILILHVKMLPACGWPLNIRCPNRLNAEYMRRFRALYFSFCYRHGLPYYLVSQLAIRAVMFTALTHSAYVFMANIAVDRVPNGFNWLIVFAVSTWLNPPP